MGAFIVLAGLLAATVVGALVVRGVTGSSGGADDPEAAVQALADAVDAEDAVAAIAALDPGEVHSLGDLYGDAEGKADSLGLTGKGRTFAGIDLRLEGLTYDVEELSDDVAKVTVTAGKLDYEVDADQLGETVQGAGGDDGPTDTSGTVDQEELRYRTERSDDERDPFLMVTKRDGGWYVSPFFTIAEYVVDIGGYAGGDFDADRGTVTEADSPEEAVRGLADSIAELDPDGLIDLLASDADVLRAYRKAIDDGWRSVVTDCEGEDCSTTDLAISIDDLELDTEELGDDRAKVTITGVTGSASYTDAASAERVETRFRYDGECLEITGDGEVATDDVCFEGSAERFGIDRAFLIAVEDDGHWAVSPTDTLLEYGRLFTGSLDERLVRRIAGTEAEAPDAPTVEVDEPFDAELNDAGWAAYRVALADGETVSVSVDSSDLDDFAYATLYDPDGEEVDTYQTFTTDQEGTYTLVVERENFEAATVEVAVTGVREEEIELGEPVESSIDEPGGVQDFTFAADSGDTVAVTLDSDVFTAEVLDPSGETISSDDGQTYQLTDTGTHRVRVSSYSDDTGEFSLLVEPPPPYLVDGAPATSVEGALTDGFDTEGYDVEVAPGELLSITLTPDAVLDAALRIYDADFNLVDEVDTAFAGGADL